MRPSPLAALAVLAGLLALASGAHAKPLLYDGFNAPNGPNDLITNEYAFAHPQDTAAVRSPIWEMDSGSFFSRLGVGVTGAPDGSAPDRYSTTCTHSAVFRLNTKRRDFGDVLVQTSLRNDALVSTSRTPAQAWDGVHLWLRYQSQYHLYYATVNRRDGSLVIKKKCPGGPSNSGVYYTLASRSQVPVPFGRWQLVGASAHNTASGAVALGVYHDGRPLLRATDTGTGCAPITAAGAVGVRGDNDEFALDGYSVSALTGDPTGTNRPPAVTITSPVAGGAFTGTVTLSADATDDRGVTKVEFLVDGKPVRQDYSEPYSTTYAVPSTTAAGEHTVTARAYDTDGATSESSVTTRR